MLKKLLKYDLQKTYKILIIFYSLSIFFAILTRIFLSIENSFILNIIGKICGGVTISMIFNILINNLIRLWVDFKNNLYKDESYLTHTLPVEKKTIFASKVVAGIISVFTTTIVTLGCVFICYYTENNIELLKQLLEIAATTYNTTVLNFLLVVSILIFVEILFILLIGFAGIIIGHRSNKSRIVKSLICSFVLYGAFQLVTLGVIFGYGIFDPAVMNLINTTEQVDIMSLKSLMYVATVAYSVYVIVVYIIGKKQLEKGVNVE